MKALYVVFVALFLASCNDVDAPTITNHAESNRFVRLQEYLEGRFANIKTTGQDPGRLHNELLSATEKRLDKSKRGGISRKELAAACAGAANEVMKRNDIPIDVTVDDMRAIMVYFDMLSEVYDFWGKKKSDPNVLLDYLATHGYISDRESAAIRELLRVTDGGDTEASHSAFLMNVMRESGIVRTTASIGFASTEYWRSHGHIFESVAGSAAGPALVDRNALGEKGADLLGGLCFDAMFPMLSGATYIVAGLASMAFMAMADIDSYTLPPWADPTI